VEKNEKTRQVNKRQLAPSGQKIDVFKLGKAPIPMPFSQSREDMLTHFAIARGLSWRDDPPNTDHLVATPKPNSGELEKRYKVLHFYIDRKLEVPVLIVSEEKPHDGNEIVTRARFDDVKINQGMAASEFDLDTAGFEVHKEYLAENTRGTQR